MSDVYHNWWIIRRLPVNLESEFRDRETILISYMCMKIKWTVNIVMLCKEHQTPYCVLMKINICRSVKKKNLSRYDIVFAKAHTVVTVYMVHFEAAHSLLFITTEQVRKCPCFFSKLVFWTHSHSAHRVQGQLDFIITICITKTIK